jgi:arylformamidase
MTEAHKTPIELAYSPSSVAPHYAEHIAQYEQLSLPVIKGKLVQPIAYGEGTDQWFWSNAQADSARIFIYIHGGYWQFLSANESLFFVEPMRRHGIASVSINYSLAPQATIKQMMQQCARAVAYLAQLYPKAQLVLAGSSAGAHLCSALLADQLLMERLAGRLMGVVLCSGVFDLRPLVPTYINDALGLTLATALDCSPLYLPVSQLTRGVSILAAWAEQETAAFKGQSRQYGGYLQSLGVAVHLTEIAQRNHFNIVFDLSDPKTELGARVLQCFI